VETRAVGAPPRPPRIARDATARGAPPRAGRRMKPRERVDFGGRGDDGDDGWFFGGGGGGSGDDGDESRGRGGGDDDDADAFKLDPDALLEFERKVLQEMETMDAHALYAWQSACAVTLVGCVQHVIDTIACNAARVQRAAAA